MPLYVKNSEVVELVESLAKRTGETKTDVLLRALRERVDQLDKQESLWMEGRKSRTAQLLERIDKLPVLDPRAPDEILGYKDSGHF